MNLPKFLPGLLAILLFAQSTPADAASLAWDPSGAPGGTVSVPTGSGGAGVWNTSNLFWSNSTADVAWNNLNGDNAIFGGTNATVTLSGSITVNNLTFNTQSYTISGNASNTLTVNGTITSNQSAVLSAPILGSSGLTKAGTGTLGLNAANTYTGNTVIAAASLQPRAANALPAGTTVIFGNGGSTSVTLDVRASQTVAGLSVNTSGSSTISNSQTTGATILTVNPDGAGLSAADSTFSGLVRDGDATRLLGLAKSGSHTLTLSGSNTYSGGTTVSAGTLLINTPATAGSSGTGAGNVAVTTSGARLGGTGIIRPGSTNAVTVGSGAVLTPGDSTTGDGIGTLTLDSGGTTAAALLTLDSGAKMSFQLGSALAGDKLNFWNYAGATDFVRNSNVIDITFLSGAAPGTYNLFNFYSDSGTTLTASGISGGLSVNLLDGGSATLDYSTPGQINLQVSAIPEPAILGFLSSALFLLTIRRCGQRKAWD